MLKILIPVILFFASCSNNQKDADVKSNQDSENKVSSIKLLFVGDLLLDRGVRERIEHVGIESLFSRSIDSIFSNNDLVIANLECPATFIEEPINKKYIFRADPNWLATLKSHGVSHLNLANNHSMDQGRNGLVDTDKNIRKAGLTPLGFGLNVNEACKPLLIASEPRNVFLLSSLQVPSENWLYFENKPCVCEKSLTDVEIQIRELKENDKNCIVLVQ